MFMRVMFLRITAMSAPKPTTISTSDRARCTRTSCAVMSWSFWL